MKGFLNTSRINYVLFHLRNHVHLPVELEQCLFFAKNIAETLSLENQIIFLLSDQEPDLKETLSIDSIPILFPIDQSREVFYTDDRGNVIFRHDFLKSIFYLLSGHQEYANKQSSDNLKRFSFEDSVQSKLGFTHRPIVNYYFDFLIRGLEQYASTRSLAIERRRLFSRFGFMLTHDIDKIDLFDYNFLVYKLKEIIGLRKSRLSRSKDIGFFAKGLTQWIGLTKKENPYWNFEFLRKVERERGFRSVFYFLDQGVRHSDAYYSFFEKRVVDLFSFLKEENCEIGLHGPVRSKDNRDVMKASLNKLERAGGQRVTGNRQHRLLWSHPGSANILESCGLKYDTTLGFAAHEGFRNSYCLPFKLYDFENERMIDLWEFPLNVMDGTLFAYRNYTAAVAMEKCMDLIREISNFGGIFTLLWHNSFFDDVTYPGVTQFYLDLLDNIHKLKPENVLGRELTPKMNRE